jgi:transposase
VNVTCGIDWAEAHHDVALSDEQGRTVARARINTGIDGYGQLLQLLAEHSPEPAAVPIAIETDKNLLVVALLHAGFEVYAINPRAVARYRERHGQTGKKSDPGDAAVLAGILRTDRHLHRPLPRISDQGLAVKALARQHQEAIWALHQTISRMRAVLLQFYPQAVTAFPKLQHHAATAILAAGPHTRCWAATDSALDRSPAASLRPPERHDAGRADPDRPAHARTSAARSG